MEEAPGPTLKGKAIGHHRICGWILKPPQPLTFATSMLCPRSESISDPNYLVHFLTVNRSWIAEFLFSTLLFPTPTSFSFSV